MPDDLRKRGAQPNALVASAALLSKRRLPIPDVEGWQKEAWAFYDSTPEVRFAVSWLSNALGRCRLMAAHTGQVGDAPTAIVLPEDVDAIDAEDASVPEHHRAAADLVHTFGGGPAAQAQILSGTAVHLTVPGEGYLVGEPAGSLDPDRIPTNIGEAVDPADVWGVYSAEEVAQDRSSQAYTLRTGAGTNEKRTLPEDALIVRFWRRHAREHWRPDSPLRATLGVLRELTLLTQHIEAAAVSRLAGAGLLVLPDEITFPVSEKNTDAEDPFMAEFIDAMVTPISDRAAASAVVPMVIRIKGDLIGQIQHLTFGTPLDEKAMSLREEAIKRFAAGIDLPAEVVLGLADSNHWTAWQIEESAVKLHVEPMLEAICEALTIGYLHPALEALGLPTEDVLVWYDASELTVRPDRSGDAREAFRDGAIGLTAYLREIGMSLDDAPSDEELQRKIILDVIRSLPSSAPMLLPILGIDIEMDRDAEPIPNNEGRQVAAPPEGAEEPEEERGTPDTQDDVPDPTGAALAAAADALVARALERAGNRLANRARKAGLNSHGCPVDMLHTCLPDDFRASDLEHLLEGAWDRVPEVAARYDMDPHALTATLDNYTRDLIHDGWPHDFDRLAKILCG